VRTDLTYIGKARAGHRAPSLEDTMPRVVSYHRPSSLVDALTLLRRAGVDTRVLGGGTILNAGFQDLDGSPIEVVDLQALDMEGIGELTANRFLSIGSMTTLGAISRSSLIPNVLRELAKSEAPNTLRNMATVGGVVASAHWESAFLAGLLAHRATVTIAHADATRTLALAELLGAPLLLKASVVTEVTIECSKIAAWEAVRRTPADSPIVAVVGARFGDTLEFAVSGGAIAPFVYEAGELRPPEDFRGSSTYRSDMISTLIARVTAELQSGTTSKGANS
jgi:CO/xanthine dehydrogenase FAD-binding subunit